ncbi:MAG: hypothetical protein ABSC25_14210 [Roseiarcus sp.]
MCLFRLAVPALLGVFLCGCNSDIMAGFLGDDSGAKKTGDDSDAPTVENAAAQSGVASKVFWFTSLKPDCRETPGFSARIVDQPEHGTVTFERGKVHPRFEAGNPRSRCNSRLVPGWIVTYAAAADFVGHDKFSFDELFADGASTRVLVNAEVK